MTSSQTFSEELGTLEIVFSELCEEEHIAPISLQAEGIAAELVRLFQSGVRDEEVLLYMMRARRGHCAKLAAG